MWKFSSFAYFFIFCSISNLLLLFSSFVLLLHFSSLAAFLSRVAFSSFAAFYLCCIFMFCSFIHLWSLLAVLILCCIFHHLCFCYIFSRVHATLHPALSVGLSVCLSHFTFFMFSIIGPHCSCPNGLVTSNMAPAHPHATSVAVYPALFLFG